MTEPALTRRTLLGAAIPLAALPLLGRRGDVLGALAGRETLRVGVLLPAASGDATAAVSSGVLLGAEESARTASLFGLALEVMEERSGATAEELRSATRRLVAKEVVAVVAGAHAAGPGARGGDCHSTVRAAAGGDALVLNVGGAPDGTTVDRCHGFAVHMSPGAAAVRRARAAYARRPGATGAADATIGIWHHTLRRFGAEQLNERFRRRFGTGMTSPAWAGWAAMKIITESALRSRSARGADLARFLATRAARFDGHKGEPLAFDGRTGELRQPLYVIHGDGVAAELSTGDVYEAAR
jgi:hypothetical protein